MNLNEFIDDLSDAIHNLPSDILDGYAGYASDAGQVIKARVQETGKNAQGVSLADIKDYTPQYKRQKAGLTVKKIKRANKKLASDLEAGRTLSPTTLNKTIGIAGRYRGFVDLTLTGRMFNNIQVHTKDVDQTAVIVSLGPVTEDNKAKLEKNVELRGQILELSKAEQDSLNDNLSQNIQEKFNSYFQ